MQEILLYGSIYIYSASEFIKALDGAKGKPVCVRTNCGGGDVFGSYGMTAKFQEYSGEKKIKVDGIAASAAAFMLLYANDVECLDVSQFLFHRAAYGTLQDEAQMSEPEMKLLNSVNASYRSAMEAKCSPEMWAKITGSTYDEMFSMENRIDVTLNAEQMKQLGIVKRINPLTVEAKSEIVSLANKYNISAFVGEVKVNAINNNINTKKMTITDLKASHPELYAQVLAEGARAESIRVKAWLAYSKIDATTAIAGAVEGKELTQDVEAEFKVKAISAQNLQTVVAENAPSVTTPVPAVNADAEKAEWEATKKSIIANVSQMINR